LLKPHIHSSTNPKSPLTGISSNKRPAIFKFSTTFNPVDLHQLKLQNPKTSNTEKMQNYHIDTIIPRTIINPPEDQNQNQPTRKSKSKSTHGEFVINPANIKER